MRKDTDRTTRFEQTINDIKEDYSKHKSIFITALVVMFIMAIILTSLIVQLYFNLIGDYDRIYPGELLTAWTSSFVSLAITLFVYYAFCSAAYRFRKLFDKEYIMNYEENYKQAKSGVYGDAHWMKDEEKEEVFDINKDITKLEGDIIGYDEKKNIYAIKDNLLSINRNKIIFGASRSGKSAAIIINDVLQCMRRGESIILTDTKGDLYRVFTNIAKLMGYIVKAVNLKPKELKNSDAWDPMKYVTKEDTIQAEVLANAIIVNTLDGARKDFWANNEMNCLKAAILLVATSEAYAGHRSFGEVVNIVSDQAGFDAKFAGLEPANPARLAFDKYAVAKDDVKKQILNGMSIRLALLDDPYVKQIVSHDEVDLLLPMRKKCIYFVIVSDTDTSMQFLSSMFFTQIFMAQCDYSDGLSAKNKEKQLAVRYELDEFKNVGLIPFFDVKISTFASRKISSTLCLQTYAQLKQMYPNGGEQVLIANSSTKILLKAGDLETAELFKDMCGVTTTIVNNGRYSKDRSQILDVHDKETMTDGYGKRDLLMTDKALKLHRDTLVCCISGCQPIKLNKYIATLYNPLFQDITETPPNRHKPKWRKQIEMEEEALRQRFADDGPKQLKPDRVSVPTKTKKPSDIQPKPVTVKETDEWCCEECGTIYPINIKICSECGTKNPVLIAKSAAIKQKPIEAPKPPAPKVELETPPQVVIVKRPEKYPDKEDKFNRLKQKNKPQMQFNEEPEESMGDEMLKDLF